MLVNNELFLSTQLYLINDPNEFVNISQVVNYKTPKDNDVSIGINYTGGSAHSSTIGGNREVLEYDLDEYANHDLRRVYMQWVGMEDVDTLVNNDVEHTVDTLVNNDVEHTVDTQLAGGAYPKISTSLRSVTVQGDTYNILDMMQHTSQSSAPSQPPSPAKQSPSPAVKNYKRYIVKFADTIPSNITNASTSLFNNIKIDNDYLHTAKLISVKFKVNDTVAEYPCIYFPNIAIPKILTLHEFQLILGYLLIVNISSFTFAQTVVSSPSLISNNASEEYVFQMNLNIYLGLTRTETDLMYETTSIGDYPFIINIVPKNDSRLNSYEELFYNNYYTILTSIATALANLEARKITTIPFEPNISSVTVSLKYLGPVNSFCNVDIVRLFNVHSAGRRFGKVYIHSDELDTYMQTPRQMQYVKILSSGSNPFKGTANLYNTCSFYVGDDVEPGFALNRVDIQKDTTIHFIFNNTNRQYTYSHIVESLTNYMSSKAMTWLQNIKLNDCVYAIDYNYKYYVPYITAINGTMSLSNMTQSDISKVSSIMNQDVPQQRFSTRTSISISSYMFYDYATHIRIDYQKLVHEYLTSTILYNDMFPQIHVGLNSNDNSEATFSFINASSMGEMMYMFALLFGLFKKATVSEMIKLKSGELSLEAIRKNSMGHTKALLKTLTKIDPVLFGPRVIKGKPRSFSGLCQKHKQRVVPVTRDEYEFLKGVVPDAVVNIQNQTYPDSRLYLFCPYKQYGFLNYHRFNDQMCIIRCTTKPSNKQQYNFCAESLDAKNSAEFKNKYENQTITLYNPLITKGRKCQVPDELRHVLVQYILQKLSIGSISQYCLSTYEKYPFIIRRNPKEQKYIMMSEYNEEFDYILILQSEINDDYFIFIHRSTGEPLLFSKNDAIRKFFMFNVKKTNAHYDFFNYVESIIGDNISEHYNKTSKVILTMLSNKYDIKYVLNNDYVCGVIMHNTLYLTPKLYWNLDAVIATVHLYEAIENVMNGRCELPSIDLFNERYAGKGSKNASNVLSPFVERMYMDYTDKKIKMIRFKDVDILIKPCDMCAKYENRDIILFDYNAVVFGLYYINMKLNDKFVLSQIKKQQIGDVLQNYIFIYTVENGRINEQMLKENLIKLGIIYDKETFIVYNDKKTKWFVSWRSSKINEKDFDEYLQNYQSLSVNDVIKSMYNKFQNELRFKQRDDETIHSKIISV